jgi:cytidylate kinase
MGHRASGKSTVGRAAAAILSWPHLSFGSLIRERATSLGLTLDPLGLEQFGEATVNSHGHLSTFNDLLEANEEDDLSRVFIDRYARWLSREGTSDSERSRRVFDLLGAAPVERRVPDLRRLAEFVLDGTLPVDLLAQDLVRIACARGD